MDYNVVRTHATNAFKYYKNNDKKFNEAMTDFYTVGKENPSVAGIIFEDTINKGIQSMLDISKTSADGIKASSITPSIERIVENETRIDVAKMALLKAVGALDFKDGSAMKNIAAKEGYDMAMQELYPRTGKIRKAIIKESHLKPNEVTPKMSWGQKIRAVDSTGKYSEIYPKSHAIRSMLILNGQIKEGEVTPRVKWYKRFSYKPFIDKTFSFAKKVTK